MNRTFRRLLPLALLAALLAGEAAAAEEIEVITSRDQVSTRLDPGQLRAIFTMRQRQWPDGAPTRVFVLPDDSALHSQFCRQLLGTYPYVLRGVWDRLVFTGTGLAPTVVSSEAEMRARVQATAGAIGYVRKSTPKVVPIAPPGGTKGATP